MGDGQPATNTTTKESTGRLAVLWILDGAALRMIY